MGYSDITGFLSGTFTLGTTVDFGDGYVFTVRKVTGYYIRNESCGSNITLLTALARGSFTVEELRAKAYDFGKVALINRNSEAFPEFVDTDSLRDYCRYLKGLKDGQRIWTKSDLPSCHLEANDLVYLYNAHTGYRRLSCVVDSPSGWFMVNGISALWESLRLDSSEVQNWAFQFGRKALGYFPFMSSEENLRKFLTAICDYNPEEKEASLKTPVPKVDSISDNFYDSTAYAGSSYETDDTDIPLKTEYPNCCTIKLKGIHLNNPSFEGIKTTITL